MPEKMIFYVKESLGHPTGYEQILQFCYSNGRWQAGKMVVRAQGCVKMFKNALFERPFSVNKDVYLLQHLPLRVAIKNAIF